jgi:hypothetical protein
MAVKSLRYFRCETCEATLLDDTQWLAQDQANALYRQHQNDPFDPRYRAFLSKLAVPLLAVLPRACFGLDYGCGPGSALASMLREAGHTVSLYDPLFAPDVAVLSRAYDFIGCSETFEHFTEPAKELDRLVALLKPGGVLAIMTSFQTSDAAFATWSYRRDPTHIVFYRERTFRHLAAQRGLRCSIPSKDVALLHKA